MRAGVAPGHAADQVVLEPFDRLAGGQLVDLGRVDAAVDRPGHQRHAARLRRVVVLRHQRHRGQRRHAGLAHRHQVRAWAEPFDEGDDVLDVFVQAEAAFGQRHVARVVPVGDVHVVVGQHGARGVVQQRREVARQRRHDQHLGPVAVARRRPGRRARSAAACRRPRACTATSRTGTSRSPMRTESMPNDGRWCVRRSRENTSQAAASLRVAGVCSRHAAEGGSAARRRSVPRVASVRAIRTAAGRRDRAWGRLACSPALGSSP